MSQKRMLCMLLLAISGTMFGMDEKSRANDLVKKAAIGATAGTMEIIVNSPLIYLKNTLQQPDLKVSRNPMDWYRGFRMNVGAMGPTSAFQVCADAGLESVMPGSDLTSKVARAFTAGALSAAVNGPVELVIIDQQKNNGSLQNTCKKLVSEAGWKVLTRGWTATALREGAFTTGYLVAFPELEKAVKNKVDNAVLAYVCAGGTTGLIVATATHPIDTVKTRMQADYMGSKMRTMRDAVRMVYKEGGISGFFSGVAPRAVRAGLAIPLMGKIKEYLSKNSAEEHN